MREVLISIQPKWCELIASGKKTVEVRKTRPKIDTPFKCYIYCTNSKKEFLQSRNNVLFYCEDKDFIGGHGAGLYKRLNGKVIGEFVCDRIRPICYTLDGLADVVDCNTTCLNPKDFIEYGKGKTLYGWHISDLVIYDKPKELSEFKTFCKDYFDGNRCEDCEHFIDGRGYEYDESDCGCDGLKPLKRPPQSWCYVEGAETNG